MIGKKYQWTGFDFIPNGCLLEQIVDLSEDMGFAYERSTKFFKDFHTHDRLMLVFPRGTSSMEVRTQNPRTTFSIDDSSVLLVPKDLVHDDEGTSSIYDTMAFYPSQSLLETVGQKLQLSASAISKMNTECFKVQRTPLTEAIAQGYFFEKVLRDKNLYDKEAVALLGRRLLEEVLLTAFAKASKDHRSEFENTENLSVSVRALRFIEANLFEPIDLDKIATASFASVSTLLRKFKQDVETTPYVYIKNRRLEEAFRLLKTGQHPVGDVALLVGYESFGAFSEAFKEKYGHTPSATETHHTS